MTPKIAKRAFFAKTPVTFEGITYPRISALIYRDFGGQIGIQIEMEDKNRKSAVIAAPAKVSLAGSLPPQKLPAKSGGSKGDTLYEIEGIRLTRVSRFYNVFDEDGEPACLTQNPLTAWTKFFDMVDHAVREKLRSEIIAAGKDKE